MVTTQGATGEPTDLPLPFREKLPQMMRSLTRGKFCNSFPRSFINLSRKCKTSNGIAFLKETAKTVFPQLKPVWFPAICHHFPFLGRFLYFLFMLKSSLPRWLLECGRFLPNLKWTPSTPTIRITYCKPLPWFHITYLTLQNNNKPHGPLL